MSGPPALELKQQLLVVKRRLLVVSCWLLAVLGRFSARRQQLTTVFFGATEIHEAALLVVSRLGAGFQRSTANNQQLKQQLLVVSCWLLAGLGAGFQHAANN
jgi:hypothetical protein